MIQLIDVCKTYQVKKGPEVRALNHVNLTFGEKGLVFILGKSGSGKSTLLNVIGGLDRIDSGDIVIMGKSSKDFSQAEFDSYRNTYLGFIFQEYNILPDFTIGQNIALALQLQGLKGTDEEVDAILDQVDLHGLRERKPNELSGGQKQRVAIARALIKKPQIIMADEPTGALDSKTGQDIFNTLKKLAQDHLVIVVSHDREFAESFGDRVIELSDGEVKSDLTKSYHSNEEKKSGSHVLSPSLLSFEKGHVLTEEDIALLNQYFAQASAETLLSNDEAINTNVKASAKINLLSDGGSFQETKAEDVSAKAYRPEDFKLKKSRLPFLRSLKIALNSLKSKPFRLVVTSLLVICSLTMFGVSATLAGYSPERAFVSSYQNFGVTDVSLTSYEGRSCGANCYTRKDLNFSFNSVKALREETGMPFMVYPTMEDLLGYNIIDTSVVHTYSFIMTATFDHDTTTYDDITLLYSTAFKTSNVFASDQAGLKNDYHLDQIAGRFPNKGDEVLITSFRYEAMKRYGYSYTALDGNPVVFTPAECADRDAFLAKKPMLTYGSRDSMKSDYTYQGLTIVGIVDTSNLLGAYADIDVKSSNASSAQMNLSYYIEMFLDSNYVNSLFGMKDLYSTIGSWSNFTVNDDAKMFRTARSKVTLDEASLKKWYRFLAKNNVFQSQPIGLSYDVGDTYPHKEGQHYNFTFATAAFSSANSFIEGGKKVFFWIGFGTACFAALLLATFIASSVSYQRRKIGILRAIGARGGDIYGIFYNESLLITLSCAIIAVIITVVIDNALSKEINTLLTFTMPVFQFNFWIFLLILALAVVTATIASFIPCLIISKKKPIDSINEK